MRCPMKQKLANAMTQLESEVSNGNVNGGAHLRLCKRLKDVYDARINSKNGHVRKYLITMLVDDASASWSVPMQYRDLLSDPVFLRHLLHAKRKEDGAPIDVEWCDDLMEGYLPPFYLQNTEDKELMELGRLSVLAMLYTRWNTIEMVERRLDKLGIVPVDLFPVEGECPEEASHVRNENLNVWTAIASDPRFIRWLLKDSEKHYTKENVLKLKEYAFTMADKMAHRDEGWMKALGVRHMHDTLTIKLNMMLGKSFEEAREMALSKLV